MKEEDFEGYKPDEDPQIRGDAFKTLFVGRLNYEAKESDLEREFGRFGPIERVRCSPSPRPCRVLLILCIRFELSGMKMRKIPRRHTEVMRSSSTNEKKT